MAAVVEVVVVGQVVEEEGVVVDIVGVVEEATKEVVKCTTVDIPEL